MTGGWQVGIDIGGTFTDVVALEPASGDLRVAKVATRCDDHVSGLRAALAAVGLEWREVADLIHGTTMVTNAIIQNDLADVALIATQGFSDTLAIGRQNTVISIAWTCRRRCRRWSPRSGVSRWPSGSITTAAS